MMRRAFWPALLGAALTSCSPAEDKRAAGPASADEERALSQAAEMLDERPRELAGQDQAEAEADPAP